MDNIIQLRDKRGLDELAAPKVSELTRNAQAHMLTQMECQLSQIEVELTVCASR